MDGAPGVVGGLAGGLVEAESPQPTWNAAKPANAINTNKFFIEMLLKVKRAYKSTESVVPISAPDAGNPATVF
jgi:hypothetical protein